MNVVGIVKTRLGLSTSAMPARSLIEIEGKPVLQIILERLRFSKTLGGIVVATTVNPEDNATVDMAARLGVPAHRGPDRDVLSRVRLVAEAESADLVVLIAGNYPLVDATYLDELVHGHIREGAEFSYNEHKEGIIYGMGVEVLSAEVLEKLSRHKLTDEQRELGTLYLKQHFKRFRIYRPVFTVQRPNYKVCLQYEPDVEVVREIFQKVPDPCFESVVKFLDANPLVARHNNQAPRGGEISLQKLAIFPQKLQAIQKTTAARPDPTFPISVELSLTNACNYKCVWCSDMDLRERLGGELDTGVVFKLIEELKAGGTRGVVIEGGGEPTLHRDFNAIVEHIRANGLSVGLITNGHLLPYRELIGEFDWIRVSLDCSSEDEFKKYKGLYAFERVMENIRALARTGTMTGVGYIVTKDNTANLEPLVLRLKDYGVSYIQFRPVIDTPDIAPDPTDLSYLKKYESPTFSILLDALEENKVRGNAGVSCRSHSLSSVIAADGSVYICGRLNIYEWWKPFGNLYHSSFTEIWHGEERRRQSAQVLDPSFCGAHCPECRLTKYNVLLDRISKIRTRDFI
ncbi:MAG: radical SAM protein [Candidatus Rokubacteria bacterium]|nr:radical SAM protein [Candidatus Rokubacteria bacterium]